MFHMIHLIWWSHNCWFYKENFDNEKEKHLYYNQMKWYVYSCITQAWIFSVLLICTWRAFNRTEMTLL